MEQYIQIDQLEISEQILHLHISGELRNCVQREKVRMLLLFEIEAENRRIPIDTSYIFSESSSLQCDLEGNTHIDLSNVFYRQKEFDSCKISILLEYGYEEFSEILFSVRADKISDGIQVEPNYFMLDSLFFVKKEQKRKGPFYPIIQIILFLACIILFPLFFVEGMKRSRKINTALRYVSTKTSGISGISYSKREWKTHFFKFCYQHSIDMPVVSNRIVFLSERKLDKSGNLFRIMETLKHHKELEILLMQKEKTVSDLSFWELHEIAKAIATAKILVLDDFYPQLHALFIRKDTEVIQLWHACGAFKTFGFTRIGKPGGASQQSLNHRSYDYAFVSGEKIRGIYSEAFGISLENVIALGVPRTDDFFSVEYKTSIREKLYKKYPLLLNRKVVLLAPTFRGDGNKDAYYPSDKLQLNQLCEKLPDEYCFIIKNHPFVKKRLAYDERYKNRILDLSSEENINDLLFVTDVLVTDYSSVVFEAAMLNLPMVFYAFDLDDYMKDRDVYYDYERFVPGPIVFEQEDLCTALLEIKAEQGKNEFFKEYFLDAIDGNSTERIGNFIYDRLQSKK